LSGELLCRSRCIAMVVQFWMRSAIRGISRREGRRFDEDALAELHTADAKRDV
jgi:hypothetical protein